MKNHKSHYTGSQSVVGKESDYRSRGRWFDPSPVPYFCGCWSSNNFYDHSPPSTGCCQYVQVVLVNPFVKLAHEKSVVR